MTAHVVPIGVRTPMGRLRLAARIEGSTLLLLIAIAVPLKYLGGTPAGVRMMGPVHGIAFIAYLLTLAEATAAGGWSVREIARTALLTIVPFGPFFNDGFLARKAAEIAERGIEGEG